MSIDGDIVGDLWNDYVSDYYYDGAKPTQQQVLSNYSYASEITMKHFLICSTDE